MNATIPVLLVSTVFAAPVPSGASQETGRPKPSRPVDVSVEGLGRAFRQTRRDTARGGSLALAARSAAGFDCAPRIADQADPGGCLAASSSATLGMLFPYPGDDNAITGTLAFVGGGESNQAPGDWSTVAGGRDDIASGYGPLGSFGLATVGGGRGNTASGAYATIGGGRFNVAAAFSTVGGGTGNAATGRSATAGGGNDNEVPGSYATVAGGNLNEATGAHATVGGGNRNIASGLGATVGGGGGTGFVALNNVASGDGSTVGGGLYNAASGTRATVPGGYANTARGNQSFAAGRRANAIHNGSFVWGDSQDVDKPSSVANEFNVYCRGGARLFTNAGFTTGVLLAPGGSTWTMVSDRDAKENVEPVDARAVLDELAGLPLATWNYKDQDDSIRHLGPMAQDFYAAFGLGLGEKTIDTIDPSGVALAAIQGLNGLVKERDAVIAANEARMEMLTADNEVLRARLDRLEALVLVAK